MSDYLPPEIQINILSRLPPVSLLRFRCVCKSWRSLITSPNFIATHLNRTNTNKLAQKLLFTRYKSPSRTEQISLRFDSHSFTGYARFKCPFEARVYFRVVGICNGLVCLSDDRFGYTYTCYIWNPAIHRYLSLPKPSYNTKNSGPYTFVLGFGFDVKKNDYKVVRLAYLELSSSSSRQRGEFHHATPKVEIFSVGTCSWRTMKRGVPAVGVISSIWTQVYLNGAVHWSAYKKEDDYLRNVVLVFDMAEEKFRVMGFPSVLDYVSPVKFTIGLHKESLALFVYDSRRHCTSFAVYVLKQYGVVESWCAMYLIGDVIGGISTVPGFREDGELLVVTKANELVPYDPKCKCTTKLGIRGVKESVYAAPYAESLVFLNGLKGRLASQLKSYKKSVSATKKWSEMDESKIEKHVDARYFFADVSLPFTANSGIDLEHEDTTNELRLLANMALEFL